jgi:TolB-like protein
MTVATHEELKLGSRPDSRNRVFHFLLELRRRRVCRAITMYSVAMWLVCQIVDVISPALELPEWTLKLVVVFGLLGLPVIIMMSWLFEITPDGLVVESPDGVPRAGSNKTGEPKHIADRLIDLSLILASLAIGVQLAIGAVAGDINAVDGPAIRIAVTPFQASTGEEAVSLSEGLAIELQHALKQQFGITVIASSDPRQLKGSMRLTGSVTANKNVVRVAVTMIDFDSGVVTWSAAFQQMRNGDYLSSADLAQQIAAALPMSHEAPEPVRLANVAR